MKLNRVNLLNVLTFCQKAVSSRSPIPEMTMLLLKSENGALTVAGASAELFASKTLICDSKIEDSLCVPPTQLIGFVSNIPDDEIALSFERDVLRVSSKFAKADIKCLPADGFPMFPKKHTKLMNLDYDTIGMINRLFVPFTLDASNSSYPQFHGIRLLRQDNKFSLWAFDSGNMRASYFEKPDEGEDFDYNIFAPALNLVQGENVQVWTNESKMHVIFVFGTTIVSCPLLLGSWVRVAEHCSKRDGDVSFTVNANELATTLKLANAVLGPDKLRTITVTVGDSVSVHSSNDKGDVFSRKLDAKASGQATFEISLAQFFQIADKMFGEIEVSYPSPEAQFRGIQFRQANEQNFTHAIMPLVSK